MFTEPDIWQAAVAHLPTAPVRPGLLFKTLRDAVTEWNKQPAGTTGVITILDSLSELDAGLGNLRIRIPEQSKLLIIGAQWPQLALSASPARGQFQASGVRPQEAGFEAVEAENGFDALAWLASGETAHLVFVDWEMPEMYGISFVRKGAREPRHRDVRLVMVTKETRLHNVREALEAGADEYIMKPFTKDVVRDKLQLLGMQV